MQMLNKMCLNYIQRLNDCASAIGSIYELRAISADVDLANGHEVVDYIGLYKKTGDGVCQGGWFP